MYDGLAKPTKENFTYATKNQDSLSGDIEGAVLNTKNSGISFFKHAFKTLIAPINPFKLRQHSHPHGYIVHGVRKDHNRDSYDFYPFRPIFEVQGPNHFDPTSDVNYHIESGQNKMSPTFNMHITFDTDRVPYICEVNKKNLEVCKVINGGKCQKETDNFLEQCPNFALRVYRKNKMFNEKAKQIQREEYKQAMKIGEYNRNRTMQDVSRNVSYTDGMAKNLRPDSMWVDDRYSNITQKDIDRVKAKLAKKRGNFDFTNIKGNHLNSPNEAIYKHEPRMY